MPHPVLFGRTLRGLAPGVAGQDDPALSTRPAAVLEKERDRLQETAGRHGQAAQKRSIAQRISEPGLGFQAMSDSRRRSDR